MVLGTLLTGFIVILVGVNLFPAIGDAVSGATVANVTGDTNVTGAAKTILGLTNIFFALGILAAGVNLAVSGLRQAGMF